MTKFNIEEEKDLIELENGCETKIYNKYFKNSEDIEESILSALKPQMQKLTYIYICISIIMNILKKSSQNNSEKIVSFYRAHLLKIFAGIDIAITNFCTMAKEMKD